MRLQKSKLGSTKIKSMKVTSVLYSELICNAFISFMAISQSASNERMWSAEKTSMNLEFLSSLTPHQLPKHLQTFRLSSKRCDLWIFLPTHIYQTFQTYMLSFSEISNVFDTNFNISILVFSIKIHFCHLTHTSPTQLPWPNLPPKSMSLMHLNRYHFCQLFRV